MPDDQSTRDIAVKAQTNIEAHLTDCASFRGRIEKSIEGLFSTLRDQDKRLNRQTWILGIITGAWFAASWVADHLQIILKALGHS